MKKIKYNADYTTSFVLLDFAEPIHTGHDAHFGHIKDMLLGKPVYPL